LNNTTDDARTYTALMKTDLELWTSGMIPKRNIAFGVILLQPSLCIFTPRKA